MFKFMRIFGLVCIITCAGWLYTANGAEPSGPLAVILGPEKINVGSSAWLKTTGSSGKDFKWVVVPPAAETNFTALPIYGGMDVGPDGKLGTLDDFPIIHQWGHFSSGTKGVYYFILVVSEGNKSAIAVHTLTNGGVAPDPQPNPDPQPDPDPQPIPIPEPVINIPTPVEPYLTFVKPITPLIVGKDVATDSLELAMFYLDLADVLEKDDGIIKTTGHILQLNQNAGQLMFQKTGIKGKYTNLASAIDKAMADALTLENTNLDNVKRDRAVKVIKAIAWACLEAGKKK